jgi:hemin uptake protein HemP
LNAPLPQPPGNSSPPQEHAPQSPPPRTLESSELFHGAREVMIRHAGECYRLRVTRTGKLILHK